VGVHGTDRDFNGAMVMAGGDMFVGSALVFECFICSYFLKGKVCCFKDYVMYNAERVYNLFLIFYILIKRY